MSATDAILPPGVWQSIAGHLQLAEWARACGTCREMFCLPLKTLNITERVPLEGLLWASKRWARAQRLRIEYPEAAAAEVAGLLMGRAPDLDGLAELVLDCPRAGSLPQREAACMWLGGLLARAGALRVLSIALDDVPALPPLRQLAHLKLTVYDGAAAHVAASLPALVSLVTFAMAFQGAANAEEDGAPLQIPPLRLASLAKLRYVGLSGVAPAAITLPPACKLEVKDCGDAGMEAWQSVAASIGCISVSNGSLLQHGLPALLALPCGALQLLHLHLGALGQSLAPLDLPAHLLRVKWCCISTKKGLHVNLAHEVLCEELSLISHRSLGVGFSGPAIASFLAAKPKFQFSWRKCFGDGLVRLTAALAAAGVPLEISTMHGYTYLSGDPLGPRPPCRCGACYSCAMAVLPKYEWTRGAAHHP